MFYLYNSQAFSKKKLRKGIINPSGTNINIPKNQTNIKQVIIIPKKTYSIIEKYVKINRELSKNSESFDFVQNDFVINGFTQSDIERISKMEMVKEVNSQTG